MIRPCVSYLKVFTLYPQISINFMSKQSIVFSIAMSSLFAMCSLTSCSENQNDGIVSEEFGTIKLDVATTNGFQTSKTRAVDESQYSNLSNYKVRFTKDDVTVKEFTSATQLPESIEMQNGSYLIEAFYGAEQPKSRDMFLSKGAQMVSVQGDNKVVSLTCEPTCAKATVKFASSMSTYFDNYQVDFSTKALGTDVASWNKNDKEPWYLLVDKEGEAVKATIKLTPKDKFNIPEGTILKTYTLKPNEGWTLNIAPNYSAANGQLGITITIDTNTDDIPVDIVVPSDWVTASN